MIYAKITRDGLGGYLERLDNLMNALNAEFDGVEEWGEEGEKITIELIEMEEFEFENLPEFEGW